MNERSTHQDRPADFSDRVLAFSIDAALAVSGYCLSLKLAFPGYTLATNPFAFKWSLLWMLAFLLYQAFASSSGRASLGKSWLGLRVVGADGGPLGFVEASIRSLGYLLSSILSLGFLWALFVPSRRAWHDTLVSSKVVSLARRSESARLQRRAAALACLGLIAGVWAWEMVLADRYYSRMGAAYAQAELQELAALEEAYYQEYGHYTDDLVSLASVSIDPKSFLEDLSLLVDLDAGLRIRVSKDAYTILAKARNLEGTEIRVEGP